MFCDRLLAAGGMALLLTGCGAKGPPRPPVSHAPLSARDVFVRQAGNAIEVRWSRPRQRVDGARIEEPLTFRVLARTLERTGTTVTGAGPAPTTASPQAATPGGPQGAATGQGSMPAGGSGASGSVQDTTTGGATGVPGTGSGVAAPAPASPTPATAAPSSAPGGSTSAAAARASEEAFVKDARVVAEIVETPEQVAAAVAGHGKEKTGGEASPGTTKPRRAGAREPSSKGEKPSTKTEKSSSKDAGKSPSPSRTDASREAAETQYSVILGPEHFPGARFTSVRLALAVVVLDAKGRRARPRPILEIDPVETLAPPSDLRASATQEGVALTWHLAPMSPSSGGPNGATALAEPTGVDVYRAEIPRAGSATEAGGTGGAAAQPVTGPEGSPVAAPTAGAIAPIPRFPYKPLAGSPFAGDGTLDRSAVIGTTYVYEARRVSLAPGRGLRESASSGTTRIEYRDLFPPGPPALVTAVFAGADGKPTVHVAWSAPIDADVAGYRVYKAEGEGAYALAATVPSATTEWMDSDVRAGATYRYTVAAIDAAVPPNESERSEAAEAATPTEGP